VICDVEKSYQISEKSPFPFDWMESVARSAASSFEVRLWMMRMSENEGTVEGTAWVTAMVT